MMATIATMMGHHRDDALETLLLNMAHQGRGTGIGESEVGRGGWSDELDPAEENHGEAELWAVYAQGEHAFRGHTRGSGERAGSMKGPDLASTGHELDGQQTEQCCVMWTGQPPNGVVRHQGLSIAAELRCSELTPLNL